MWLQIRRKQRHTTCGRLEESTKWERAPSCAVEQREAFIPTGADEP